MACSERETTGASTCAAAALVAALALIAATVPASGGERAAPSSRKSEPVGHVTRITGDVRIGRGIRVRRKTPLRAGDFLDTGPSGEAKLDLKLKGMGCTVWSKTQLRVRPSKHVGFQIVSGNSGDVYCVTSSQSREKVVVKVRQLAISMKDPVFSVSVRRSRAVIKVSRGSVILTGPTGIRRGVVVARNQQSVVPTGRDPREPQPIKLTSREQAAFAQLERRLPTLRDTTPPKTMILNGPRNPTKNLSATFAFRANETPVNYSCSVDRAVFRVCSSPMTYPAVPQGNHTFAVRATDPEGNVGKPATYGWRVTGTTVSGSFTRQVIARSATAVQLEVDAQERALVTYRTGGQVKSVLAWGAINALPPTPGGTQVRFKLLYGVLEIRDVCGPYRGPPLAWQVVACTAPDGTHWALQQWQRGLPNYGVPPTPEQAAPELRLSHWSGPLAQLTIKTDWAYRGKFDHLYGSLTYRGQPVHGFRSTARGVPLDPWGRNIFVDTFDSVYGPGWKRENSFLTHRPTGAFCYGFYLHPPHPLGNGSRYRATVIGPGVTPDVFWEGPEPGPYDPARDEAANLEQRQLFAQDKLCKIN